VFALLLENQTDPRRFPLKLLASLCEPVVLAGRRGLLRW